MSFVFNERIYLHSIVQQSVEAFGTRFGNPPEITVRAPGRVNLIGEHTDYNEGYVFPAAIDRWVAVAARPRSDNMAVVYSVAYEEEDRLSTSEEPARLETWVDYVRGIVREFQLLGHGVRGFDAALAGNVPVAAGLSSSAAVEMAVGRTILELCDVSMSGAELALLGQRAENRFVGVNCGIMDQFISANGRKGHALFLDCRDLSSELVPLAGEDTRIVICNSGVRRGLTASAYNQRRSACEAGVRDLARAMDGDVTALRDISEEELQVHKDLLPAEIFRRCRHVVSENARTREAVGLLKRGDLAGFGRLMDASHRSLRDDYEVSGPELDLLVDIARGVSGVYGARMTGAGFGGCTVNLVQASAVEALAEAVQAGYPGRAGLDPEVYVCSAVEGAERLD